MNEDEHTIDPTLIRDYLLGRSTEAQKQRIEDQFAINDAFFEQVEIAEDELLQEYAKDSLSAEERIQIERFILCDADKRLQLGLNVELRRSRNALRPVMPPQETPAPTPWWFSAPMVSFVLASLALSIGLGLFMWRQSINLREMIAQRDAQLEVARKLPPRLPEVAFLFRLRSAERSQGGEVSTLSLPAQPANIRFQFALPATPVYRSYEIQIRRVAGPLVWSQGGLVDAPGGFLTINVSSQILHQGDYLAVVSGVSAGATDEVLSSYPFRLSAE